MVSGATAGFRHRARLAIRGRLGSPKVGLFELDTHHVVHIPSCSVQHPLINRVADVVRRALVDARVTSYSDAAHLGLARYLQVVIERSSQTAQVVIVGNSATAEPFEACLDLIRDRLGSDLHSLWFNANCERSNTILGAGFQNWCGPASVVERFGGAGGVLPAGRVRPEQPRFSRAHRRARARARFRRARESQSSTRVSAPSACLCWRASAEIRMNEISPHSLHGLELGLAQLDAADRAKVSLVPGPGGRSVRSGLRSAGGDCRSAAQGPGPELTEYLSEQPPERFVYVSCGLDSFLNDVAHLTSRDKLRLAALTAFNLMPFTSHVETVARFERA